MTPLLSIKDLFFGYTKDKLLFDNFSMSLQKGEIKAIVGESGIGKSTLFELILKNIKPFSGEISVGSCSEVFQDPYSSFHPSYSLLNQINDVAQSNDLQNYLEVMKLDYELLLKLPHELSGGQLQRASILRALLMKRDILLLDEPTSALDNIIQLEVMKMLMQGLDKIGILLITHDMELAKWCSDEVIIL